MRKGRTQEAQILPQGRRSAILRINLRQFFRGRHVNALHLSQPCDAGQDFINAQGVTQADELGLARQTRARPDKAHLAFEYIDQLWCLVEFAAPQEPSDPRNAGRLGFMGGHAVFCAMLRNFRHMKERRWRPTRCCLNMAGPSDSRRISTAATASGNASASNKAVLKITSKKRFKPAAHFLNGVFARTGHISIAQSGSMGLALFDARAGGLTCIPVRYFCRAIQPSTVGRQHDRGDL